jgi:hypothetical protein
VQKEFNVTHWAQVQKPQTAQCMRQLMASSLETMEMSRGVRRVIMEVVVIMTIGVLAYF